VGIEFSILTDLAGNLLKHKNGLVEYVGGSFVKGINKLSVG
jgi:hypothetical protein